jgi:cellulase/cellobiase CelA1
VTPTVTPTPGDGCTVALVTDAWNGGFVVNATVTARQATSGWRVSLALPAGASITNGWNATFSGTGGTVTATNVSYNGLLGAGQTATFGFQGTGSPSGLTATCTAL